MNIDEPMSEDAVRAEVARLCGGNQDAVNLIYGFWNQCEIWDDLVDQDKPVSGDQVNDLILWALFDIQHNAVYQAAPALHVLLRVTIANWLTSNKLAAGNRDERATAYTLRCSPYDFFVGVVLIVSGPRMADEASLFFRSLGSESLETYLAEAK